MRALIEIGFGLALGALGVWGLSAARSKGEKAREKEVASGSEEKRPAEILAMWEENRRLEKECLRLCEERTRVEEVSSPGAWEEEKRRLEEEIREWEGKLAATAVPSDQRKLAEEVLKRFSAMESGRFDMTQLADLQSLIAKLKEESGLYFLERYRSPESTESERLRALMLLLTAGGPSARDFLLEWLRNTGDDPDAWRNVETTLMSGMKSTNPEAPRMMGMFGSVPIEGEVEAEAVRRTSSADAMERKLGASILGWSKDPAVHAKLDSLMRNDGDLGVRAAAIQSLEPYGDRAMLEYLRSLPKPASDPPANPREDRDQFLFNMMVRGSIEMLEKKLGE